jgi:26S proteasome regulatory subunit N9
VIAEKTKLSISDVEYLLMKSLSVNIFLALNSAFQVFYIWYMLMRIHNMCQVHLIEGIIDQVEGTVHVSWVQPRVLGITQVKSLTARLDAWVEKVHTALLSVEAETPDLVAA